jgi:hypothetical protein
LDNDRSLIVVEYKPRLQSQLTEIFHDSTPPFSIHRRIATGNVEIAMALVGAAQVISTLDVRPLQQGFLIF